MRLTEIELNRRLGHAHWSGLACGLLLGFLLWGM